MPPQGQNSDLSEKSINISPDAPDGNQDGQDGSPNAYDGQDVSHTFIYILAQAEVLIFALEAAKQSSDAPNTPHFISEGQECVYDAPYGIGPVTIVINIEQAQFKLG